MAFKQGVCGFDLLRSKGQSFVCDVNGFSLVKSSKRYYIDCASQIRRIISHKQKRSFNNLTELMDANPINPNNQEKESTYRPEKNQTSKEKC